MKTLQNILKTNRTLFSGVFALSLVFFSAFGVANTALAATPYLSVSSNGNNTIQINVTNADPNSSINLYYNFSSSSNVYVANIGTTNSSGYFSTTLNQGSYSIPQNAYVYVTVNGQSSTAVLWPNNNNNNYGSVTLSQSSLTLGYNQSANVNIYGGNGGYYVSSNSNSSVASATVNGSTLNINTYNTLGNSNITVCSYNNNGCATLYLYVQSNYNYNQPTYFSQSNISLNVGQGMAVTVYGSGSYTISNNSNPAVVSSLINGSVLNVYGSTPGTATLNVCSTSGSGGCASLYVTVGGYYNNGYTGYNNYNTYPYGYTTYNTYTSGQVLGASTDSSVYLSQVPSTGISWNLKVVLFLIGLFSWSLFAAYIYTAKQKRVVR